jgi:hypothetical protein
MASERKVVLLIVEGSSDAKALKKGINEYFRLKGLSSLLECEVYGTDLTLHPLQNDQGWTSPEEVLANVKAAIAEFVKENQLREKIGLDEIGYIATLSDLDACYCPDSAVVFGRNPTGRDTVYDFINKRIVCSNVTFIKQRNKNKVDAFGILHTENKIKYDETHLFPFRAFYCNLNLEHALYDRLDILSEEDKDDAAFAFRQRFQGHPQEFADFLKSIPCLAEDYPQSWEETLLKKKAFERLSNLSCFLDWISQEAQTEKK